MKLAEQWLNNAFNEIESHFGDYDITLLSAGLSLAEALKPYNHMMEDDNDKWDKITEPIWREYFKQLRKEIIHDLLAADEEDGVNLMQLIEDRLNGRTRV